MSKKGKVSIVAKGEGLEHAPTEGDVWGIGNYFTYRYCSAVWEMHDFTWTVDQCLQHKIEMYENMPTVVKKSYTPSDLYSGAWWQYTSFRIKAQHINHFGLPLVSVAKYHEDNPVQGVVVPTSVEYPLFRVIFDVLKGEEYIVGTLNYAIAYAIYVGYTVIELYGANLIAWEEWAYQRPNAEYLIGIARGRGIEVNIIGSDDGLLVPPRGIMYGYIDTYPKFVPELGYSFVEETVLGELEQKYGEILDQPEGSDYGI
jgi:hypothetical protein